MKVQKIRLADNQYSWLVLGDDYLPIEPITEFIRYFNNIDKSPCTIRSYAHHFKLYWEYLSLKQLDWKTISLDGLASFVGYLRTKNQTDNVVSLADHQARKASSINSILGSLSSFYRYHHHLGNTDVQLTEATYFPSSRYKSLLHHAYKNKPKQRRILSVKQYKQLPKTISQLQYKQLLDVCNNLRDKFMIALLFETGLRIGQALALRHEDIHSWDNEIIVVYRIDNENEVRNKTLTPNTLHVSMDLMRKYNDYVNAMGQARLQQCDYLFVNLKTYKPLRYTAIRQLFERLSKKINTKVTPHMLRHTHASNLINAGWDHALVQKRLGHASVQTTIDTYTCIDQSAMKKAIKAFHGEQEAKQ